MLSKLEKNAQQVVKPTAKPIHKPWYFISVGIGTQGQPQSKGAQKNGK
jgi:hypothetical protein